MRLYDFVHNPKSIGCIHGFFALYIQHFDKCNGVFFCIETPNLDFVFVYLNNNCNIILVEYFHFTSVEVELPPQLMSIGKPLVLAIFGSELAIIIAFCGFAVICCLFHASHE